MERPELTILGDNWRLENFKLSASKFTIDSWLEKSADNYDLQQASSHYVVLLLAHSVMSEKIDKLELMIQSLNYKVFSVENEIREIKSRIREQGHQPIKEPSKSYSTTILGLSNSTRLPQQYLWRSDNIRFSQTADTILKWAIKKPNNKQLVEVCSDYLTLLLKHSNLSERIDILQMKVNKLQERIIQNEEIYAIYERQLDGVIDASW